MTMKLRDSYTKTNKKINQGSNEWTVLNKAVEISKCKSIYIN